MAVAGYLGTCRWRDEEPDLGEDVQAEMVRVAWWKAYHKIRDKMNKAIHKWFPQAACAGTEC
jgi:hypothetical protein